MQKALKDGSKGTAKGHGEGTAWGTHVSQGVGYRCREVVAGTRIPHSLWPGTPGGVSASVTGSHRRLLREGERCSNLRRVSSVMPPKRIGGRGRRGQETPPGGCGDSPRWREPKMTDTGAGQKGGGSERRKGNPSNNSRTWVWCPLGAEKPCASSPRGSHATKAG